MTRVLVTGANGFVGSHVVQLLREAGCEVTALVSAKRSSAHLKQTLGPSNVLHWDLFQPRAIEAEILQLRPESCIHLAWYAEPGQYLTAPQNVECLTGSLELTRILIAAGCRHVLATGTCAEYDTSQGYLKEDAPTSPSTLYAAAKLAFCLTAKQLCEAAGVTFTWARLFYLYGPGEDRRRLIPSLIEALLASRSFPASTGEQVRDYLHIRDVAAALCLLATQQTGGIVNVCSGEPVPVRQLMQTTADIMERPGLIQFGALPSRKWEPPTIYGDSSTLRALGWAPQCSLREGLRDTIEWWKQK